MIGNGKIVVRDTETPGTYTDDRNEVVKQLIEAMGDSLVIQSIIMEAASDTLVGMVKVFEVQDEKQRNIILNRPVEKLPLSRRGKNCATLALNMNDKTIDVRGLITLNVHDLINTRNCGPLTIKEILDMVDVINKELEP
jgi:hypothetical protein